MDAFPSLVISADSLTPVGAFAEAQAAYLEPDVEVVKKLDALLHEKKVGIVAHYYMDPELQGVLAACTWPHIGVSDSLLMADRGIQMVREGCEAIVVLGVDFMSENARAMLDDAGLQDTPLYRVAQKEIGCSLAESAEARAYGAYLTEASRTANALHVVYINTSLVTKAKAHALVPTITCTSSNVVKTVLQAAHQVEDVNIFFGPDTYMGENLESLLGALADMDPAAVAGVHSGHDPKSIAALRSRFRYFEQGNCVVHHLFGSEVVDRVRTVYPDAFVAAHLEVPGEMFALGLDKQHRDEGVVGSTSNILGFIERKTQQTASADAGRIQVVLGTEAGMVTPIVRSVQRILRESSSALEVEIVFPVASEAIAATNDTSLPIVPGVQGGEGCTTAGGCATCPYMKMNSLSALMEVCAMVGDKDALAPYEPRKYTEMIRGRTAADLGGEPILHMRAFQNDGVLPAALVRDVKTRGTPSDTTRA